MCSNNLVAPLDLSNLIFKDRKVSIILDSNKEPWFKAKDVAMILEYKNTAEAISDHVKDKYKKVSSDFNNSEMLSADNILHHTIFINEPGLYSLIMKSKMKIADQFRDWVFEEILPSIRKYGEYKIRQEVKQEYEQLTNLSLKLKQLTIKKTIEFLNKDQYIYIASTNLYRQQNYYKVGGSKTKIVANNQRLSGYNTGRPDEDNYFYFYVKECNNYKIIEDKISNYLKNFKPNDKKEMYNILLEDLQMVIDKIVDNNDLEIDYINNLLPILYNKLIDKELETDLKLPYIPLIQNNKDLKQEDDLSKLLENEKKYIHINDEQEPTKLSKDTLTIEDFIKNKIETTNNKKDKIGFRDLYKLYSSYAKTKKKDKLNEREFITKFKPNFNFKKTRHGNIFMQIKIKL